MKHRRRQRSPIVEDCPSLCAGDLTFSTHAVVAKGSSAAATGILAPVGRKGTNPVCDWCWANLGSGLGHVDLDRLRSPGTELKFGLVPSRVWSS